MALSCLSELSLEDKSFELVAAIDFGTTFSGYAFAFRHEPENIYMNKNWGESLGFQTYKTPTCVLTGPGGNFVAFGHEAEERYSQLLEDSEDEADASQAQHYNLYQHFKMILHNSENLSRQSTVVSTTGRVAAALDIFAMAIGYLKDHLLHSIGKQTEIPPSVERIRWVLTVPAIWSDEAKQFMREAALKAGCISTKDSKMLVIALEPEAASIYCRHLTETNSTTQENVKSMSFRTKEKYLVVDAGGGTIDITAHQILKTGDVKELYVSNGGPWGGTKVDEKFIALLEDTLGKGLLASFRCRCPQDWLTMLGMFEKAKRAVNPGGKSKLRIQLGWSLAKECDKVKHTSIEKVVCTPENKAKGVSFSNGSLVLNVETTTSLFHDIVEEIAAHIQSILDKEELHDVSQIILVGGFGQSPMLEHAILDRLSGKSKNVLTPPEAQLAVIRGAVLFGFSRHKIKSRIAKRTYGIMVKTPFVEGLHDERYKIIQHGRFYSTHIFYPFIEKNNTLEVGTKVRHTFSLDPYAYQMVQIDIYSTDQPRQQTYEYVHDPKYTRIGTVMASLVSTDAPVSSMDIEFYFGGTEIHVNATDSSACSMANVVLDFL